MTIEVCIMSLRKVVRELASIRCNITIEEEFLVRLDDFADKHGMTRSGLIALAVEKYMDAEEMMPTAMSLLKDIAKVFSGALNGSADDTREQIDRIDKTYEKFMGLPSKKG